MPRRRALLIAIPVLLVIAAVLIARAAQPFARPALGFVAKVVCSNVFVGHMSAARAIADLPDEPIARLVRTTIDAPSRTVSASIPLIAERHAVYRPATGCTLVHRGDHGAALPGDALPGDRSAPAGARTASSGDGTAPTTVTATLDSSMLTPARPTGAAGTNTRLDAVVRDAFAEPDPALPRRTRAIVVMQGDRILAERYADGFGPSNRFAGWSMTKSVTSALVGILVADGTLDVAAEALRPEWQERDDPRRSISLHHLLTMTSGLDFDESYAPTGAATRMLFDSYDAAAVAAQSTLAREPGTAWSYSSATTNIISALIRASFNSHAEYLVFPRTALFDRIGMHSAVLEPDPSGTFVGSSFMYATARDWARFGLLYLRDGVWNGERILPEGWVEYSVTPAAAPAGRYGAHWWLNAGAATDTLRRVWPSLPSDIYWASGFEGQYIVIVPSHDLVVVRLGVTRDDDAWRLDSFLRDVVDAVDRPEPERTQETPDVDSE